MVAPDMTEVVADPLLACLEETCRLFKRPRSASALKAGLPLQNGCLTAETFVRAAARADIQAAVLSTSLEKLKPDQFPVVMLFPSGAAAIVLAQEARDSFAVWRPGEAGVARLSTKEVNAVRPSRLIQVAPAQKLDQRAGLMAAAEKPTQWFRDTLWRYRHIYADTMLASLVLNVLGVASSLFVMNVYDRVVPNRAYETLWVLAIGVSIAFVFEMLLRILRGHFIDLAGRRADIAMSALLFERVMGLRLEHRPASAGSMASTLREFESLREFFTSATLVSIVDLPFVLVYIVVIGLIGGNIFWIPLLALPVMAMLGFAFQPSLNRAIKLNLAESTQKHGVLVESIGEIETIKSLGAESTVQTRWETLVDAASASGYKSHGLAIALVSLTGFVQQLVYVATVVIGVYLIEDSQLSMGGLIACSILGGRAMAPLSQVASLMVRYQSARHALEALSKLVALEQERPAATRFLHRPQLDGALRFEKISFSYPSAGTPAIRDASFEIRAGEHVAILGRIGSGKSTLLKLMLGLYRPSAGTLLVDGIDIAQIDPVDLRHGMGYVDQDAHLFFGTLRENIAIANPEADDAQILNAAKLAGVEEFAARHPAGYEMPIGENGLGLSGGQRQCVAIARALLRDPRLLLFDEPTSGMDQGSEGRFIKAMKDYLTGRTLVLVTHKPAMLSLVDKILLIDNGQMVAAGPRDAILAKLAEAESK